MSEEPNGQHVDTAQAPPEAVKDQTPPGAAAPESATPEDRAPADPVMAAARAIRSRSNRLMDRLVAEMLSVIRTLPKEYARMSEREQRQVIDRVHNVAAKLVPELADIMASRGFDAIKIKVKKYTGDAEKTACSFELTPEEFSDILPAISGQMLIVPLDIDEWLAFDEVDTDNIGDLGIPRPGMVQPCHDEGATHCLICGLAPEQKVDGAGEPLVHDANGVVQEPTLAGEPFNAAGAPPSRNPYGEGDPAETEGT